MGLGFRIGVGILSMVLGFLAPAAEEDPDPTFLTVSGGPAYADTVTPVRVDLVQEDLTPIVGAHVVIERSTAGAWSQVGTVVTDGEGQASIDVTLARTSADNVVRASYAGDPEHAAAVTGPVPIALLRRRSVLTIGGPTSVVDELSVPITLRWTTGSGVPVAGQVQLFRRSSAADPWTLSRTVTTGADGRATVMVSPRVDSRWRAEVAALDWVEGARSSAHWIDNLPPGRPVHLPAAAPEPGAGLPAQRRAVGDGPNAVIQDIPDEVWAQMAGVTWHAGCPVGRSALRLLRINYWDFDGYRRRGELVANADAVEDMAGALKGLYRRKLPLRGMFRVDRFGWSDEVAGGDNLASMASDNSSAFNCRQVVGNPSRRSPHSWGRSLDLNPWENPYRSKQGVVPNTWWLDHSHPRVAWRTPSHIVIKVLARHGLVWTYGLDDTQHFDAAGAKE